MGSTCAGCDAEVHPGDAFCEACGAPTDPSVRAPDDGDAAAVPPVAPPDAGATSIVAAPGGPGRDCASCGGAVGADGFCETCGAKARTRRDHWTESPAPWVGAVCDKGIRHARNEDALATAASPHTDGYAVLVVCDGVTSAPDSDQASLAAATEARDHLVGVVLGTTTGTVGAAAVEASVRALNAACRVAQVAVLGVTERLAAATPDGRLAEPPSCTFVAAVLTGSRLAVGWCGDSRAYWLGDDGDRRQVSTDHSLAAELVATGVAQADAERDPTAHTITRWLGADSAGATPDVVTLDLTGAGWLLVCSDGLWNYASTPDELAALIAEADAHGAATPTAVAESLAAVANDRGGHDNITVALARVPGPTVAPTEAPTPDPTAQEA